MLASEQQPPNMSSQESSNRNRTGCVRTLKNGSSTSQKKNTSACIPKADSTGSLFPTDDTRDIHSMLLHFFSWLTATGFIIFSLSPSSSDISTFKEFHSLPSSLSSFYACVAGLLLINIMFVQNSYPTSDREKKRGRKLCFHTTMIFQGLEGQDRSPRAQIMTQPATNSHQVRGSQLQKPLAIAQRLKKTVVF